MKEYNHSTKKWEELEKNGSLKKPKTCRGGKPHDYVLVVPSYIHRDHNLTKDEVAEYYEIQKRRKEQDKIFDTLLANIGIKYHAYSGSTDKTYICSVCLKYKCE